MLENTEKLNNHAVLLASEGEYEDAIAFFKRAITVEQSNYLLWFNLALTYRDAGQLDKAKDAMICAHKINPKDEDTVESLSSICINENSFDEAEAYCEEGLLLNNHNPRFWNNIGVVKFNRGEFSNAANFFEKAVTLSPHYYDALFNLRDTYIELKNRSGAKECNRIMKEIKKN